MLRILEEEGIAREDITLLVGTGLHRPNEGEELVQLVGADIARNYRIVNHTARCRETLTYLGETSGWCPNMDRRALCGGRPEDRDLAY